MQQRYFVGFSVIEFQTWITEFQLSPKTQLFLDEQDQDFQLLIFPKFAGEGTNQKYLHNCYFISLDGGLTFQQMSSNYYNGSSLEFSCQLEDPVFKWLYLLRYSPQRVAISHGVPDADLLEGSPTLRALSPGTYENGKQCVFLPLPEVRYPLYVIKLSDNRYIYVDNVKYNATEQTMRFFIGTVDAMQQTSIRQYDYYLDGGSTYITTDLGVYYAPVGEEPYWKDNEIEKVDGLQWGESPIHFIMGKQLMNVDTPQAQNFLASLKLITLDTDS